MIKKVTLLLCVCCATHMYSQDIKTLKSTALRDAKAATEATLKEDFKTLLTYTHPNSLDAAGDAAVMDEYLKTTFAEMKANGFSYDRVDTK